MGFFVIQNKNSALEIICESLRDEKIKAMEDVLKYKDEILRLKNEINLMEVRLFCSHCTQFFYCFDICDSRRRQEFFFGEGLSFSVSKGLTEAKWCSVSNGLKLVH